MSHFLEMRRRLQAITFASLLALGAALGPVSAPPSAWGADSPFTDIATNTFKADIEWLYGAGITVGCNATMFCPSAGVSRAQMASFLVRAFKLPLTTTDYFTDDEESVHEKDINALREANITVGCAEALFCPSVGVSRAQMASFLIRALKSYWYNLGLDWVPQDLPFMGGDMFDDDADSVHQPDINDLAAAGITTGCAARLFCPTQVVTRGQMAAFLHRSRTSLEVLPRTPRAAELGAQVMLGLNQDLTVAQSSIEDFELSGFTFRLGLESRAISAVTNVAYSSASSYSVTTLTDIDVEFPPFLTCSVTIDSTLGTSDTAVVLDLDLAFVQPVGEPMSSIRYKVTAVQSNSWSWEPGDWAGCPSALAYVEDHIEAGLEQSVTNWIASVPELCRGDDTVLFVPCP